MVKDIFEECIPTEVDYVTLGVVDNGKTLVKAAVTWKEDQKVTQQKILNLKNLGTQGQHLEQSSVEGEACLTIL